MKKINKIWIAILLFLVLSVPNAENVKVAVFSSEALNKETSNEARTATPRQLTNLAIFISFDSDSTKVPHPLDDAQSVENAEKIFNSDELFDMESTKGTIKVPSFKKYYETQSYGALSMTTEILPRKDGKVTSYRDPNPIGYYLRYDASSNPIGYKDKAESLKRETELVNNAVSYIASYVDTMNLTPEDLDSDGDGKVDAITFIIEGQKNLPATVAWGELLWSHMMDNTSIEKQLLGKEVSAYTILYADDYTETAGLFSLNRGTYGTILHEFGHVLGYKDLYRYGDSASKPVGFYDIMGNTVGSNPQHFLTYFTSEYNRATNWHEPLETIDKTTKNVTIYKPKFIDKSEKRAVKLLIDGTPNQFFVVEYHEKQNTYDDYAADESGIIIYRVNEDNKYLGNGDGTNSGQYEHVYVFRPGETALGAGKGKLSQATLNMRRPTFGKDIAIGDKTFDNESLFLSNGTNTGIKIKVTNETAESITFDVTYPSYEGAGTIDDPYLIDDANTFIYMMGLTTKNKYYKITEDLNFEDITNYPMINFEGHLDGNGKTLCNITSTNSGLFDNIGEYRTHATVENLVVENLVAYTKGGNYLGGLANYVENATIKNVHLKSGSVTNEGLSISDITSTGGFIGDVTNTVTIENCSSNLDVSARQTAGGFIGINMNARIKDSFSTGTVTSQTKRGGFIGLQAITDTSYNTPTNVYYDKSDDKTLNAVGGYANNLHQLNILDEASLARGITAIYIEPNLKVLQNASLVLQVQTEPNTTLNFSVSVDNPAIAEYQNGQIWGKAAGTTDIHIEIPVGSATMILKSTITVEMKTGPLSEAEFLTILGLTKRGSYVTGFALNAEVGEIRNKISAINGATLKSFKTSEQTELTTGIVATGMQFTVTIDATEYEYTIVIKGDVNGDGLIYATDYVKVKNHIMGKSTLSGPYLMAADINADNFIYATDYVQIKNHIMGKKPIEQK